MLRIRDRMIVKQDLYQPDYLFSGNHVLIAIPFVVSDWCQVGNKLSAGLLPTLPGLVDILFST